MKAIAVIDKNRALGYKNSLLFRLPTDLAHFKKQTLGKTVVMGSKTLESMPKGRPLPGRNTLVLTSKRPTGLVETLEGGFVFWTFQSPEELLEYAEAFDKKDELVIAGGASIYKLFLDYCDELILTEVDAEAENADAFFPEFKDKFSLASIDGPYFDGDLSYTINTYTK